MKITLWRRHVQTVKNGASSHKTNYIDTLSEILNLEGHQIGCIGLKVTAVLLNDWICLLVELHPEGFAPAACAAGLFLYQIICHTFKLRIIDTLASSFYLHR